MSRRKIIFIELDGGTWEVINPLIKEGKLPNLKRLIKNGVHGELVSDPPFISPKIWTSIFSGKKAQKHGVKFFGSTSENVLCKRIWDIFDKKGLRVGIFGSLVTWPPKHIDGFIIPSVFALGPETYPEKYQYFQKIVLGERNRLHHSVHKGEANSLLTNLANTIYLLLNGVGLSTLLKIGSYQSCQIMQRYDLKDKYWRKAFLQLRIATDIFVKTYKKYLPSFSTFHIHLCDAVSHRYWEFYQPEKFPKVDYNLITKYAEVIPQSYIESDKMIGKILSLRDSQTTVIVSSDHGFLALPNPPINPYSVNLKKLLEILGIYKKAIPAKFGLETFLYFNNIRLIKTTAKVIRRVKFSETGEHIFDVRLDREYVSFNVPQHKLKTKVDKDSVLDFGFYGKFNFWDLFSRKEMNISGIHKREGILIMEGSNIKHGRKIGNSSIFDLTPTMLYLMGLPVARDMDGRVLKDAIEEKYLLQNKIKQINSYEDEFTERVTGQEKIKDTDYDKLKKRLQSLGYL